MAFPTFTLQLPNWVDTLLSDPQQCYPSEQSRMELAIALARRNVETGTGGPFGAAVFELESGRLVAPGINLVIPAGCSAAHAEIVALTLAQQQTGCYRLGMDGKRFELVSSTEPCAMCLGAIPWSGIVRLTCGARDEDARGIGFDEGAKPAQWILELERRGIEVVRDVCRSEATAVLRQYRDQGGEIYNGDAQRS
ncbi:nucleoside deaminase [Trichloromonas sp.]|uniref:nucleoside deaminase n=1 Tax=Trichloromonas sp. TaxID=3069249 RepID=UPI003D814BC6